MAFNKHFQDNIYHMSMAGDIKIYDAANYVIIQQNLL